MPKTGTIRVLEGDNAGDCIVVGAEPVLIGRAHDCGLTVVDEQVSRRHVECCMENGACLIQDLGSLNGIWHDGEKSRVCTVQSGDVFRLGDTYFQFDLGEGGVALNGDAGSTVMISTTDLFDQQAEAESLSQLVALNSFYQASLIASSVHDQQGLIDRILAVIQNAVPEIDDCAVYAHDEETELSSLLGSHSAMAGQAAVPFSKTLVEQVLSKRHAIMTRNAMQDDRFEAGTSIMINAIHSAIYAPLQTRDHIKGFIVAHAYNPRVSFDEHHLKLLTGIGLQAGTAMENAELLARIEAESRALKQANDEIQRTQAMLVRSEQLAALGTMAAGIVHDLKTPTSVLSGYLELLNKQAEREDPDLDRVRLCATGLGKGVDQMKSVIQNLLDFVKSKALKTDAVQASVLSDAVVTFLQSKLSKHRVKIAREYAEALPDVSVDAGQIKRVLVNLVMNAVEAAGDGCRITLITSHSESDQFGVKVGVRDNGPGMTDEVLSQVFNPFFSTKDPHTSTDGGTGIGLSVSMKIVEDHGGVLKAESTPGEGSTFWIHLPTS